jgi:hypothetical protein
MGTFNLNAYIDDISEESIANYLKFFFDTDIVEIDCQTFLNYLKKDNLCTQYVCTRSYEKAVKLLQKLTKSFRLNIKQFDELYDLIKYNASLSIKRVSGWKTDNVNVITQFPEQFTIIHYSAKYVRSNKWGYITKESTINIYFDNDQIIWIDADFEKPQSFVFKDGQFYCLNYDHKHISIFKNLVDSFAEIIFEDNAELGSIIAQYDKVNIRLGNINFDLTDCFYKGFFYKGFLFDRNWKNDISVMKNIECYGDYLKVEIENLTYPHSGHVILDIDNDKIIDCHLRGK